MQNLISEFIIIYIKIKNDKTINVYMATKLVTN